MKNKNDIIKNRKFYLFCGFWFIIALLEFTQDYISSILNSGHYQIFESLFYKIFWLLFIPSTLLLVYGFKKNKINNKLLYFSICGLKIIVISIFHLIVFSLLLYGLSQFIHDENSWHLSWLLTEQFSNYLYITLSIYLVTVLVIFWFEQKETKNLSKELITTIIVKNGRKSVVVPVNSVEWINSDGPYLLLHTTNNKKHIISGSLKYIITSLPDNFKRIHRSTIVNINMIKELKSRMNGDYDVIMNDATILRLSRNYRKFLKGTLL